MHIFLYTQQNFNTYLHILIHIYVLISVGRILSQPKTLFTSYLTLILVGFSYVLTKTQLRHTPPQSTAQALSINLSIT
jgi:hypothetical protein